MLWKVISTKDVYTSKWMRVTEDQVETDFGQRLMYNVLHRDDFALVIPFDGEKFVLIGQYRYPVDKFSWEFPMGMSAGLSMDEVARAELSEEAGLTAGSIKLLGTFYVAPGHATQACHAYFATELIGGVQQLETGEEGMEIKRVSFRELKQMISDGTITDGPTMAAFSYLYTTGWVSENIKAV